MTPLMKAAEIGDLQMIDMLLANHAVIDSTTDVRYVLICVFP